MSSDKQFVDITLGYIVESGIPNDAPVTMSSLEIAGLLGSRHDKVKQSIDRLVERGVIVQPPMGDEQERDILGRSRNTKVYNVGKRDSYVIVAQLSPEFTARLVDRWQELEARRHGLPDFNNPIAAARAWIAAKEQSMLSSQALQNAAHKVEFYDAFLNADGLLGLQNAGRALKCKPNLFTRWLKQEFVFYQGRNLVARAQYTQTGIFKNVTKVVNDRARVRALITPKGLDYLSKRVPSNIRLDQGTFRLDDSKETFVI